MTATAAAMATSGSPVADFSSLVGQHQSMVYGIALNFLRNAAQAEDIAQDVFLELHRNFDRIESDSHAVFWLRQVTSRKCIDHLRWRRLRPWRGLDSALEPAVSDTPRDPFQSRKLDQMISSLPAKTRMALVLRYQEEMEFSEIARTVGGTAASVRSLVHRGLELLREKMLRRETKG